MIAGDKGMNILTDTLPDFITVEGKKYCVNTDFRIWLEFDKIMHLENIGVKDKIMMVARLCFDKERIKVYPENINETMDGLLSFFLCGKSPQKDGSEEKAFSFQHDSELIYSAFLTQYGIDLLSVPYMHWYVFSALFQGLEEQRRIMKIINWRLLDTNSVENKEKRKQFKKIKEFYALPDEKSKEEKEADIAEILTQAF